MRRFLLILTLSTSLPLFATSRKLDLKEYTACTEATRTQELAKVEKACRAMADRGIPMAQYSLGATMVNTNGFASKEGMALLEKAAAQGHPPAKWLVALGLLQSDDEASKQRGAAALREVVCTGYPPALDALKQSSKSKADFDCTEDPLTNFDGTWMLKVHGSTENYPKIDLDYRLEIAGDEAKVSVQEKDKWIDVKPGSFKVKRVDETLVLSAIDSGWDFDGKWIESLTFQLMRLDPDKAAASFTRAVNNPYMPADLEGRTFVVSATGTAERVKTK